MSNTEQIIALIVERLTARGWSVTPSEVEGEWSVSAGEPTHHVDLVLQGGTVQTYLDSVMNSHLPHQNDDGVATIDIEEALAADAAERLGVLLRAQGPGVLTEAGIRSNDIGAEIYSVRALRAVKGGPEFAERHPR